MVVKMIQKKQQEQLVKSQNNLFQIFQLQNLEMMRKNEQRIINNKLQLQVYNLQVQNREKFGKV
jgi:hypothetical protein